LGRIPPCLAFFSCSALLSRTSELAFLHNSLISALVEGTSKTPEDCWDLPSLFSSSHVNAWVTAAHHESIVSAILHDGRYVMVFVCVKQSSSPIPELKARCIIARSGSSLILGSAQECQVWLLGRASAFGHCSIIQAHANLILHHSTSSYPRGEGLVYLLRIPFLVRRWGGDLGQGSKSDDGMDNIGSYPWMLPLQAL